MSERNIIIRYIGGACPVQAEGTVDGIPFYFRARGDEWSMSIGLDPVDVSCGFAPGFHYEEDYGDGPYDAGWMEEDEARAFIEKAAALWTPPPQEGGE